MRRPQSRANRQSAEKQRDDALLSGDLAAAQNAVRAASDDDSTPPDLAEHSTVTEQDILLAARRRTGIDLTEERDGKRYDTLGAHLHSTIFGQAEAIDAVTDALRRHSADLTDRPTPISFLFYGPGGVGKTAVCEAVAAHLFDSSHAFLRFDMSEYREAHTVSRLIGAPPGYIGHDDGGLLTTAVRHRPYALILFDGIAHAHPDVVRLITQILDRGTLTDSRGNHVSFRHTVVVLTADTEAASPARTPGFTANTEQTRLLPPKELVSAELLSLIDAVIPFRPLDESVFAQILQSQLDALAKRLGERGITLHCDPTLLPFLLRRIPENRGTRGARRIAAQLTEQPIAQALLDKTLRRGDCVRLAPQNDTVVIVPEQGSSPH